MDIHSPPRRSKPFVPGQDITAKRLTEFAADINRMNVGVYPPTQKFGSSAAPVVAQRYVVASVGDDWVVCTSPQDKKATPTNYYVAKPYLLRRSPFDTSAGFSGSGWNGNAYVYTSGYTRTATNGGNSETQAIVPAYVAGDMIFATVPDSTGATLPAGTAATAGTTQTATAIPLLDLNVDGRAWASSSTSNNLTQSQVAAIGSVDL